MTTLHISLQSKVYLITLCLLILLITYTKSDSFPTLESTIISHGGQVLRVTDQQYKIAATLWNTAIQV